MDITKKARQIGNILKRDTRKALDKRTNVLFVDEETLRVNLPDQYKDKARELYVKLDNYYSNLPVLNSIKRADLNLSKRGTIFRYNTLKGFLLVQKGAVNNFSVLRRSLTSALTSIGADKLIGKGRTYNQSALELGHVAGYGLEQYNTPLGIKIFQVDKTLGGNFGVGSTTKELLE